MKICKTSAIIAVRSVGPTHGSLPAIARGGTVGVGIEYGFTPNWSAKIEYDYIAFGTRNTAFTSPVGPFTEDVRQNISLVKAGVNYRFNWGGAPLMAKY